MANFVLKKENSFTKMENCLVLRAVTRGVGRSKTFSRLDSIFRFHPININIGSAIISVLYNSTFRNLEISDCGFPQSPVDCVYEIQIGFEVPFSSFSFFSKNNIQFWIVSGGWTSLTLIRSENISPFYRVHLGTGFKTSSSKFWIIVSINPSTPFYTFRGFINNWISVYKILAQFTGRKGTIWPIDDVIVRLGIKVWTGFRI